MGNWTIILFSVGIKHRLSRHPRRLSNILRPSCKSSLLNPSASKTREDATPIHDRHICFSSPHSPTLSQWVFLSPSLSISLMICGWLSISVYTHTLRIQQYAGSAFACSREEVYFEHESHIIGRLMSSKVMPVGANGTAVWPRILTVWTEEFIYLIRWKMYRNTERP